MEEGEWEEEGEEDGVMMGVGGGRSMILDCVMAGVKFDVLGESITSVSNIVCKHHINSCVIPTALLFPPKTCSPNVS